MASLIRPTLRASRHYVHQIRNASTVAETVVPSAPRVSPWKRVKGFVSTTTFLLGSGLFLYYAHDSRAGVHKWIFLPALQLATAGDAEKAHEIAVMALASGLAPVDTVEDDERLAIELWGRQFSNPLGMAAGFDKHAQAIDGILSLGFGYAEIGSVTPEPQPGNPKPRVFRVADKQSLVNRYGFNSEGHDAVLSRLRARLHRFFNEKLAIVPSPGVQPSPERELAIVDQIDVPKSLRDGKVLGVNLGKNKTSAPESIEDFVKGVQKLGAYADVLVVNVSSPNTPGLRDMQKKAVFEGLLKGVVEARDQLQLSNKPPLLVKIAPDLSEDELRDVAQAAIGSGVDGIIVSNTTISRPASAGESPVLKETGGLSGPPVKQLALAALSSIYAETEGKLPIIGCGGISTGQDAIDYARAGASLVQLYTSFVYQGFGGPRQIKDEIVEILEREGKSWKDIIGTQAQRKQKKEVVPVEQEQGSESDSKTGPTPSDFGKAVGEARRELEDLLKQIEQFGSSSNSSAKSA